MEGRLDLLAIGLLNEIMGNTEERLQLTGLKEIAMPSLSALAEQHLKEVEIDPMVMLLGRFIVQNMQRRIS